MQTFPLTEFLHRLRQSMARQALVQLGDGQLLEKFRETKEEAAFARLVERHGPMVLALCRRVLRNEQEAEDAFQATFLVLFCKAGSIRKRTSLPSWLHGVAYRIASKASSRSARRRGVEEQASRNLEQAAMHQTTWNELRVLLDEEIQRLPNKLRLPLILCCLQEKTHIQAAKELGWPRTSVSARLAQAKDVLHKRLVRRGVSVAPVIWAGVLTNTAADAAVPASLVAGTIRLATAMAAGKASTATVAVALARSFLRGLAGAKLLLAAAMVSSFCIALASGFAVVDTSEAQTPGLSKAIDPKKDLPKLQQSPKAQLQTKEDPLPPGVVAQLGSNRLRHPQPIGKMQYSGDGKTLISFGIANSICVWDVATGRMQHQFEWPGNFYATEFAIDGQTLVVAHGEETVAIEQLDLRTGKQLSHVEVQGDFSHEGVGIAVAPDGKTVAFGNSAGKGDFKKNIDSTIHLVDATTGKQKLVIRSGERAWKLFFDQKGKSLAAVSIADGSITIYDSTDGKVVRKLQREGVKLWNSVVFSPDGKWLAANAAPLKNPNAKFYSVSVFELATGKEGFRLGGEETQEHLLALSPDGKLLATTSGKPRGNNSSVIDMTGGVVLWDLATGKEARRFQLWDPGRGNPTTAAFSPDGMTLTVGSISGAIAILDVASGKPLPVSAVPLSEIQHLAFALDGKRVIGAAERFFLWDAATGGEVETAPARPRDCWPPLAISPDLSVTAAFAVDGKSIKLCEAKDGTVLSTLEELHQDAASTKSELAVVVPRAMTFSPDGQLLVSLHEKALQVWNVKTGQQLHKFPDFSTAFYGGAIFSPDNRWLATALTGIELKPDIRLWDITTGKLAKRFTAKLGAAYGLAFSPDARFLAATTGGYWPKSSGPRRTIPGAIQVWDIESGKEWRSFEDDNVSDCVVFSPDGRMLATGNEFGGVRLWEMASGKERHHFQGHKGLIQRLAFAPNGHLLAAASCEAPVYVWDIGLGLLAQRKKLSDDDLKLAWEHLAKDDASKSFEAMLALAADPENAVPFLRRQLKPVPLADAQQIRQHIKELDSPQLAKRQAASAELEKVVDVWAGVLLETMQNPSSEEMRQRLQQILKGIETFPAEKLRMARTVEALEWMGSASARQLLSEFADGAPGAYLTREALGARERLRALR